VNRALGKLRDWIHYFAFPSVKLAVSSPRV
jgi:hypothetical protein